MLQLWDCTILGIKFNWKRFDEEIKQFKKEWQWCTNGRLDSEAAFTLLKVHRTVAVLKRLQERRYRITLAPWAACTPKKRRKSVAVSMDKLKLTGRNLGRV